MAAIENVVKAAKSKETELEQARADLEVARKELEEIHEELQKT